MIYIAKPNLPIQQFQVIFHTYAMALAPARPLWPVSALHTLQGSMLLASSTHGHGAGLHTSLNLCLSMRKPLQYNGRQGFQYFCPPSSLNIINHQKDDSARSRQSRFRYETQQSRSERAGSQRTKYPLRKDEQSQKLPWDKERSSPERPSALKKSSRTTAKKVASRDEQDVQFHPSGGHPQFRNGLSMPTAPWMQGGDKVSIRDFEKSTRKNKADFDADNDNDVQTQHFNGGRGKTAMHRIVDRLRNLGNIDEATKDERKPEPASVETPDLNMVRNNKIGSLLGKSWSNTAEAVQEHGQDGPGTLLPWERGEENAEEVKPERVKRVIAPTLAELTIPDPELKRLRTLGIRLKDRINVKKAGLTQIIVDKIHDQWKKSELVRLKFDEPFSLNMKRAHELSESKTGGLVIWRAGSVLVLYRGTNYEHPSMKSAKSQAENSPDASLLPGNDMPYIPDTVPAKRPVAQVNRRQAFEVLDGNRPADMIDKDKENGSHISPDIIPNGIGPVEPTAETDSERELNSILDGLGPRFTDWWGHDPLPVDADLLPEVIPGYKTPFRLVPCGKRSKLTNAEMTNLRKLARPLPIHFALGRNKKHQGLAAAIIKLWERSEIAKIAVKRGVQNTNNKLMAEELKRLTGGILLLRNKFYIVIYRGKDFLPPVVASALAEREAMAKVLQDEEENARLKAAAAIRARVEVGPSIAGTLAESLEVKAQWEKMLDSEERDNIREAEAKAKRADVVKRLERKLSIAQLKKNKAERELAKLEAFCAPVEQPADQETITNEEKFMFRRLGLKMKAFLMLGIRGVFDGVVENMHLHWKHRELVKIISKQKSLAHVEETARMLEYESGGILVAVERVSKGHAIIVYRGKNYQRPTKLRPNNLLNKRKALKRSIEMQRRGALNFHIFQLEKNIQQMKCYLNKMEGIYSFVEPNAGLDSAYPSKFMKAQDGESGTQPCYSYCKNEALSSESQSDTNAVELVEAETYSAEHIRKGNTSFSIESLPSKEIIMLQKQAVNVEKPTLFLVEKNKDISGLAMHIGLFFQNHAFVKIGLKGRVKKIVDIVRQLETATGAVLVSQSPRKITLYRGWPDSQHKYSFDSEDGKMSSKSITAFQKSQSLKVDGDAENFLHDVEQGINTDDISCAGKYGEEYDFVIHFQDVSMENSGIEKEDGAHFKPLSMDFQDDSMEKSELEEEDMVCSGPYNNDLGEAQKSSEAMEAGIPP